MRLGALAALLVGLAAAAQAGAQTSAEAAAASEPAAYPGVVPGAGNRPPSARRAGHGRRNVVTWPGFQAIQGGSRIFVQATKVVSWSRQDGTNQVVVVLRGTTIHLHNNLNPLITEHFDSTPVSSARLVRRGLDVNLVIDLKVSVAANVHGEMGTDGYYYVFVDFPPGPYATPALDLPTGSDTRVPGSIDLGGNSAIRSGRSSSAASSEGTATGTTVPAGAAAAPGTTTTTTVPPAPAPSPAVVPDI